MSSISVGELKKMLEDMPDYYEIVMNIHHKYAITAEDGERGWIAYINGMYRDDEHMRVKILN